MPNHPLVALEIHDATMWEPSRVLPILKTMKRWGYNTLVLHQNDLLDVCTQLELTANYGVSDLRLKKVRNNAAWLNRLVDLLGEFGAELFLEIKEPSFHDSSLEIFPDLLGKDGQPDPTGHIWADFCRQKTLDLLDRVTGIGGLIVNLSSPESRVSLPDHIATHQDALDQDQWFDRMIAAFEGPLAAQAKALYIRDFSYTEDMQSGVLSAINRRKGAVGASVKITAHDYFPGFPENPGIRMTAGPTIIEFEAFGEHMGWGVIPNCRVAEFRERMAGYRDAGADGILMRTSWEAITGANALDTLSAVNVYALPRLIQEDLDEHKLVSDWLNDAFALRGNVAKQAARLLLQSWQIPAASYWNDQVFPRHSCLPSTWQEGWISMTTNGMGRRDRALGIVPDDPRLTDAERERLFAAKENATAFAGQLAKDARALSNKLPSNLADLFGAFAWLPVFAQQFELATKATFYAARGSAPDLVELRPLHAKLLALADDISERLEAMPDLPHHHRVLFDPNQVRQFAASLPKA